MNLKRHAKVRVPQNEALPSYKSKKPPFWPSMVSRTHVLTPYIGHLDQYVDNSDLRSHFDERRAIESLEGKSISWRCSSGANRSVLA